MPHILFRDKKIYYQVSGSGKPVMLLHGFGENGSIWSRQIEVLSGKYLIIVPDIPGSGQSEKLDGRCTIEDYAEVVKAITDEVIFKSVPKENSQFSLIGHSMGGYITLAFAEKYPDILNSFGLFHSSAFADDEAKKNTRRKGIDFIQKNGSEAFLKASVPNLFAGQTKKENPELVNQLLQMGKSIEPAALTQYYEAMILRPDRTSVLETFLKPVFFVMGKYDNAVSLDISLLQCHLPSEAIMHILQHSGHMGMWEEDELSSIYLGDFLKIAIRN
ncbi:MAG TPA: alpha/beta hydrolase [Hanamia sp.]